MSHFTARTVSTLSHYSNTYQLSRSLSSFIILPKMSIHEMNVIKNGAKPVAIIKEISRYKADESLDIFNFEGMQSTQKF